LPVRDATFGLAPWAVPDDGGFTIDRIALRLEADVPGIDETKFLEIAKAKAQCPVSKALASVPEITLAATLRR